MNSKIFSFKTISVCLVFVMLFSAFAPAVYASVDEEQLPSGFRVTGETTYKVVNGVTERHFTINNKSNTNQIRSYALEIDLSDPNLSIIAGYNDGDADEWGKATVLDQAAAAERTRGVNVIAGINADFFNTSNGAPSGLLIMNGVTGHGASGRPYFAILNDGTPVIRSAGVSTADVKEAVGGDGILVKNGKVVRDNTEYLAPRTAVGIRADNSVVFFVADGRQMPDSCGMNNSQLSYTMLALGCVDALGLDGGGSSTFATKREASGSISTKNIPSYAGVNRAVSSTLLLCSTAQPTGVFDHVSFSQDNYECNPGSWVKISYAGVDANGYAQEIPQNGKLVISDPSLGRVVLGNFFGNGKEGTAELSYVVDGEVVGSAVVNISNDYDDAVTLAFKKVIQAINNLINTVFTVFEKLASGTTNRF